MSYNGSGTFQINTSGQPVVTGTSISSTVFNALTADLATGLSTAITKDGQTTTTARIPFALGINSTLVTDATNTTSGSIITAGGVGIAKAVFIGTTLNVAGASTMTGSIAVDSVTDSSSTTTGSIQTDGGVGIAKALYVGTTANVAGAVTLQNALSVTGVTTVQAGTAALPAITTTGDTNTGLFFPAADTIAFAEGGAECARFDSSSNFGIGTTSPSSRLHVKGTDVKLLLETSSGATSYIQQLSASPYNVSFFNQNAGSLIFGTNDTERMRIAATGEWVLGDTVAPSSHKIKSKSVSNNGLIFTGTQDVANDGTVSVTISNATMLMVSDNNTGTGALFFCTYASATITLIADPSSRFATSITAGRICVTKSAVDSTVTITNKFGSLRPITVSKVSTSD